MGAAWVREEGGFPGELGKIQSGTKRTSGKEKKGGGDSHWRSRGKKIKMEKGSSLLIGIFRVSNRGKNNSSTQLRENET